MPEVISLLSSSEAGSSPPRRARQPSPRQAATAGNRGPKPKATVPVADDDVWTFSDDENVHTSNAPLLQDTAENAPVGEPSSKKRRLDADGLHISSRPCIGLPRGRTTATGSLLHTARWGLSPRQNKSATDWLDDPIATSSPLLVDFPPSGTNATSANGSLLGCSAVGPSKPGLAKVADTTIVIDDIVSFASSSPARPTPAWDPVSSSAPLPAVASNVPANSPRSIRRTHSEVIALDDSDSDCMLQPNSEEEFPDIADLASTSHRFASFSRPLPKPTIVKQTRKPAAGAKKTSSAGLRKTAEERGKEKEEKAAAREAERERKKLEKERARQEKMQEKARAAALAEVNKIRTDKRVSTPEMIVDMPESLDDSVKLQAETLLRDLDVSSTLWPSPVENVVKWRRKVRSRYNNALEHWEPIPERIEREGYAMVVVPAAKFVGLVLGEEQASLESHVLRMKRHFGGDTIIYLLEGLELWLRKNRNIRNRQFVAAVRSGLDPAAADNDDQQQPPPGSQAPRRRTTKTTAANPQTYIDEDAVEHALLQLQVQHGVLVHHTALPLDTARWIAVFTQHISTAPYRRQRDAAHDGAAAFCMDTGQVRAGDGPRDTYVRMLQEVGRVTAPVAHGIAAAFPCVARLVAGLERGGPLALEKVPRCVNRDCDAGDRTIGPAVSRRVCKIFLGRDENSTDI